MSGKGASAAGSRSADERERSSAPGHERAPNERGVAGGHRDGGAARGDSAAAPGNGAAGAVPEKQDSLLWVAAGPGIWAVHFTLSYATAAVWCAKQGSDAPLSVARAAIGVFTLVGLVGVALVALRGLRRYRTTEGKPRIDVDTSAARHQFLGFTLLSLAGLSAVAIVYQALAAVFIGSCR